MSLLPSLCQDKVGHRRKMFSELNTRPGCASVNASPGQLPTPTHHSRPRRLARSYLVRLLHSQLSSGLCRRTLSPLSSPFVPLCLCGNPCSSDWRRILHHKDTIEVTHNRAWKRALGLWSKPRSLARHGGIDRPPLYRPTASSSAARCGCLRCRPRPPGNRTGRSGVWAVAPSRRWVRPRRSPGPGVPGS